VHVVLVRPGEGIGIAPITGENDQQEPDDDDDADGHGKPERPALATAPIATGAGGASHLLG
jgi:hypothetical protein